MALREETGNEIHLTFLLSKSLINPKNTDGYRVMKLSEVELTTMSSKGQLVIPQDIRKEMGLTEGVTFAVIRSKDTILLKKIEKPSKEEILKKLERFVEEGQKTVKKLGIKQSDVQKLIHKGRGIKE